MDKVFSKTWLDWNFQKKKKKLTPTLNLTLKYFNSKYSLEEIAKKRNFKLETIEYQVIELITMGFINILDLISKENLLEIEKIIKEKKPANLKDLKNYLPKSFSYFNLKSYLAYRNQEPNKL
jgi:uncharacterized protein YpbB